MIQKNCPMSRYSILLCIDQATEMCCPTALHTPNKIMDVHGNSYVEHTRTPSLKELKEGKYILSKLKVLCNNSKCTYNVRPL